MPKIAVFDHKLCLRNLIKHIKRLYLISSNVYDVFYIFEGGTSITTMCQLLLLGTIFFLNPTIDKLFIL